MRIVFTDTIGVDPSYAPSPAIKNLPDWYKKSESYTRQDQLWVDGKSPHTIKKCVPVLDSMSAGYLIKCFVDIQVTQRDGIPYYEWRGVPDAVLFHAFGQLGQHPQGQGIPLAKLKNPWAIRTPLGWSSLIVSPMHGDSSPLSILPAIVDTDTYNAQVNLPFVLKDKSWVGLIPAGTPIAQVIPIRRESWKMTFGNEKERAKIEATVTRLLSLMYNSYRKQFWSRKEYR